MARGLEFAVAVSPPTVGMALPPPPLPRWGQAPAERAPDAATAAPAVAAPAFLPAWWRAGAGRPRPKPLLLGQKGNIPIGFC